MMAIETKSPGRSASSGVTELSERPNSAAIFTAFEKNLQAAGVPIIAVCRRANVTSQHYYMARAGQRRPSRWYMRRLDMALASLVSGEPMPGDPGQTMLLSLHRAFLLHLAEHMGVPFEETTGWKPRGPAAIARHGAWYLLSTEFAVRPARIADLFGVTRAAVTQALQAIEDRREDPAFDAALERIGARIMGRT